MPLKWMVRLGAGAHVFFCRLSGGAIGKTFNGQPVLLLTSTGRKSGKPHTTPLVYLRDGPNFVVAPGLIHNPAWYLNLKTAPRATIQIGNSTRAIEAEEARPEERSRLWAMAPPYWNDYQKVRADLIPVMVLRTAS